MLPTPASCGKFAAAALFFALPAPASALEEVIVTATRSPVALASYAGSATRISASAVDLVGATHSAELLNRADFAFGDYRYFPGRGRAYFVELGWRKD